MTIIVPEPLNVTDVTNAQNLPDISYSDYNKNNTYSKGSNVSYIVSSSDNVSESNYIAIYTALGDVGSGVYPDNKVNGSFYWGLIGVKNEDAFLDKYLNTQTISSNNEPLKITFNTTISDTIACLNVDCRYIHIEYNDGANDVEYVTDLREVRDIWSDVSYPDIVNKSEAFFNVPLNNGVDFTLTFTNVDKTTSTGVVGVGKIIAGRKRAIGETLYPVDVSLMVTYSKETESGVGAIYNDLQYTYKDVNYTVYIENSRRDLCYRLFDSVAGKNVLFVPSLGDNYGWYDGETSIISYGFFQDFSMNIEGANISEFNISVEGVK
jgi:hypothetical protein